MNELWAHPRCAVSHYGIWVRLLQATAVKAHYSAYFIWERYTVSAPALWTKHSLDSLTDLCPVSSAGQHLIFELPPCLSSAVFLPPAFLVLPSHTLKRRNYSCHSHTFSFTFCFPSHSLNPLRVTDSNSRKKSLHVIFQFALLKVRLR